MPSMTIPETPTTRAELAEAVTADLKRWVEAGVARPMMPVYGDLDSDGLPDYYALDTFGRLVIIDGDDLEGHTDVSLIDQAEVGP